MTAPRRIAKMPPRVVLALVVLAVLITGGFPVVRSLWPGQVRVTAYFERTTGLYAGDDVRMLGVKIGSVDRVTPVGDRVEVRLHYDASRKAPADAMAAIVAPSLVSSRYVQLAPVYRGGPVLADGAAIPIERTAVPVEWGRTLTELQRLVQALGPDPAHRQAALRDLVNSASAAFTGSGQAFRDSLAELARAAAMLSNNRGNLFATVRNLNEFVTALNQNSDQLTVFASQLAPLTKVLADNRHELGQALATTDKATRDLTTFIRANKHQLGSDVHKLTEVLDQVNANQVALANVLHAAPTLLGNLYNSYDPNTTAIGVRLALAQLTALANTVCQTLSPVGGGFENCKRALGPVLDPLNMESTPVTLSSLEQVGPSNQRPSDQPAPPGGSAGLGPLLLPLIKGHHR